MLVNGKPANHISVEDRGLLYGDGLFETILCESGNPILFDEHMQRLQFGCSRLNFSSPDVDCIFSEVQKVSQNQHCIVKVLVTRGVRERGYQYDAYEDTYTRIVYRGATPKISEDFYRHGIRLFLCKHKLPENEKLAGIKHLNRLDQVIARSEWTEGYEEGITLSNHNNVIEGTMSNIFIETRGGWITPMLNRCGVRGVLRDFIITHADEVSIKCVESDISLQELKNADSIFVCNSVIGVWPVTSFEAGSYPISERINKLMRYLHTNICSLYPK